VARVLSLSLVAEQSGHAVGHVAISPAEVGGLTSGWFMLGPVGVLPVYQGRGVGSALIREALKRMCDRGALGVALVGEPEFYRRFGFRSMPGLFYQGVPEAYVLAVSFTGEVVAGEVVAHAAFHMADC
jgi:putative acetyltransferase